MGSSARISRAVRWLRRNPIYTLAGFIASVIGIVAGLPAVLKFFNIPECITYSDIYYYHDGHFKKRDDNKWIEYQKHVRFSFREMHRSRDYITLINETPRNDPRWASMLVRLPVCGGTAQWAYQNPEEWVNLFQVSRKAAPEVMKEQAQFE